MEDTRENTRAEQRKQVQKEIMSLSTSILAGAVIVAAAVLLSANMMVGKLGVQRASQSGNTLAPTEEGDNGAVVEVTDREDAPREGNGSVIVYEFSDFQCPFCQSFWNTSYKQIKENYIDTGKITFIYRHFPLSFHQNAEIAAEAGECANKQGKFWPYHDILFAKATADGTGLDAASLKAYAKEVDLNTSEFNSCLDEGETSDLVKADMDEGKKASVNGTPTFFINGKRLVGALPYSEFEKAINEALK